MSASEQYLQAMTHAKTDAISRPSWLMRRLPWALLLLPILQGFWFVHRYGVNVVWIDQWDGMAPLFEKWFAGTLHFADFWAQHNVHRCLVPRIVMFLLGLLTRWNTVAEMYATQIVLALLLMILIGMFLRDCKSQYRLWLMLPIGFLAISLRQIENFLWGWQLAFVMAAATTVAALACLSLLNQPKRQALKLGGALLFAAAATFSSAFGLLVWPVGLLPILLAPLERRRKTLLTAGWIVAAMSAWLAYFCDYVTPSRQLPIAFSFEYFANILGSSLFERMPAATTLGVIVLLLIGVIAVLVYREGQWGRHSFWLALLAYGLLVQLQITLGRSEFGAEQALTSRYTTCSLLIIISIYAILTNLCGGIQGRGIQALWALFLATAAVGVAACDVNGYQLGWKTRQYVDYHAFMAYTSDTQPDKAFDLSADVTPDLTRRVIAFLREHRWNLFATSELDARFAPPKADLPELSIPPTAKLTYLGPKPRSPDVIEVDGWAADADGKDVAGGVFLEVDGVLYPTYYGWYREDAPEQFHDPRLRGCGFLRYFPDTLLAFGRHKMRVKVLTKDRTAFFKPSESVPFNAAE